MSEIFQGLLTHRSATDTLLRHGLSVHPIGDHVIGLEPAAVREFSERIISLATDIAPLAGKVLVVRWDTRLSLRQSLLFTAGGDCTHFGERDETFVPLDEDGFPLPGPLLRRDQLLEGEEYETSTNAIELGLRELGGPSWQSLRELISRL